MLYAIPRIFGVTMLTVLAPFVVDANTRRPHKRDEAGGA